MKRVLLWTAVLSALCSGALVAQSVASKRPTRVNPKDGSVMVTIPSGKFIMGSNDGGSEAEPAHTVYLDTYEIGKYEVTVAQFRKFCKATGRKMPKAPDWGWKDDHPMVNVTWEDAKAYCEWAGGRLPTEAQREKAARGGDGRKYPWGSTWDRKKCANTELALTSTARVGSYPSDASPYGCMDMAGNVYEWCADRYSDHYYKASPPQNPKGPASGMLRVLRGGAWICNATGCLCTGRNAGTTRSWRVDWLGFRIAR
jgi:formylglycine-generating enzyme